MELIRAKQKHDTLRNDILAFESHEFFKVWWLGQSGFLVKWQGKYLLLDPYLSDSLSVKYQHTEKPHVRMSELAIDPARLDFIDVVTSSHNHTDHLDAATLIPILDQRPDTALIIAEANREFVAGRINRPFDFPIGLNDGITVEASGFTITGLPSAHNTVERNEKGECKFMGFIIQFGGYTLYHSGDTVLFDGLPELLESYNIDIAFLPINGNKPERKVAGNLSAEEAAKLAKETGIKLTIPHHYHMFEFNTEDPAVFESFCKNEQVHYKVLEIGEGMVYPQQ
jgi:L-ascorbate metabolism protein UlaG (beta-lactamase superfamily)